MASARKDAGEHGKDSTSMPPRGSGGVEPLPLQGQPHFQALAPRSSLPLSNPGAALLPTPDPCISAGSGSRRLDRSSARQSVPDNQAMHAHRPIIDPSSAHGNSRPEVGSTLCSSISQAAEPSLRPHTRDA